MKLFRRLLSLILFAVAMTLLITSASVYYGARSWRSPQAVEVVIRHGTSVRGIARQLAREKVIGAPRLFELWARFAGLDRSLRAGTYAFPAGSTMEQVLGKLKRGEVKHFLLTIIEGWTIKDIAAALEGQPYLADAEVPKRFAAMALDPQTAASLGFSGAPSLEGYLFPDTYLVDRQLTPERLIKRLVARFREVWQSLDGDAMSRLGMTEQALVTLASVVEKETGKDDERPLIASVFYNRLKLRMPLQSDPTIIYGLPNFNGNIRKQDITNPHAYNTYVHAGLPPGPICNPGKAALDAVLHPAKSDFLFFVSRNDGSHKFSATLSEHTDAVRQYQPKK